jgi:hypothetical protein
MKVFNAVYLTHFDLTINVIENMSLYGYKCHKKHINHRISRVSPNFLNAKQSES